MSSKHCVYPVTKVIQGGFDTLPKTNFVYYSAPDRVVKVRAKCNYHRIPDLDPKGYLLFPHEVTEDTEFVTEVYQKWGMDLLDFFQADRKLRQLRLSPLENLVRLFQGVKTLHDQHHIHGDLALENIFIDDVGSHQLILADFDYTVPFGTEPYRAGRKSSFYWHPNNLPQAHPSSDIFALASIIYLIYNAERCGILQPAFRQVSDDNPRWVNRRQSLIDLFGESQLTELLYSMWSPDPKERPDIDQVLSFAEH